MKQLANSGFVFSFFLCVLLGLAGCQSAPPFNQEAQQPQENAAKSDLLTLR